jgi:hypothetical protein
MRRIGEKVPNLELEFKVNCLLTITVFESTGRMRSCAATSSNGAVIRAQMRTQFPRMMCFRSSSAIRFAG